jgi:organic hydroperoxide reductase OsmC/OhrA
MTGRTHHYEVTVRWTGNTGSGTSGYKNYRRDHEIASGVAKQPILGSSDPGFRGDPARWNPEELLVVSLSACHELWYLHLCAEAGVVVIEYVDDAEGIMEEAPDGSGAFRKVTLKPRVSIDSRSNLEKARALHDVAHAKCFIANSVNFPVEHKPVVTFA